MIAVAVIVAPISYFLILPRGESAETELGRSVGARTAVVVDRPGWHPAGLVAAGKTPVRSVSKDVEERPARRGYCLDGVFYDLEAGQPDRDPKYRGAVRAYVDPSTGAVSCDFPPTSRATGSD
jgi:hypothetical protein